MSMTGIFYAISVEELPASIAVVLLFQFTWIGVVIEAIANRTFQVVRKLYLSLFYLLEHCLLAVSLKASDKTFLQRYDLWTISRCLFFILCFCKWACCYRSSALYEKLSYDNKRYSYRMLFFPPTFLTDGALQGGLWKYAFFLGLFGVVVPVICFSIGVPKVGTGLGTILGAAELPTAIIASITLVHEVVTFMQWIGIIFILLGILLLSYLRLGKKKHNSVYSA